MLRRPDAAALATLLSLATLLLLLRPAAALQAEAGAQPEAVQRVLESYLSNEALEAHLQDFAQRCGAVARLSSIGESVEGRPLYVLEMSDRPGEEEAEPHVKYVGNVHGDEPTGRVLTLALAEWLCAENGRDARATRVLRDMHLWLLPSMNPDGFAAKTRENRGGKDLNRDFPDRFAVGGMASSGQEQPETKAIMAWSRRVGFVASASMHEGALVANYPWDGTPDKTTAYTAAPDDATFLAIASTYAQAHKKMALPDNKEFPNGGTTNGAAWYPIYGSMQDWNYVAGDCFELTLELSPGKWPAEAGLPQLWEDNRDALLQFPITAALGGVHGTIQGEADSLRASKGAEVQPLEANITVLGIDKTVRSRLPHGAFFRPLAPGEYAVQVEAAGYEMAVANVTVREGEAEGAVLSVVLVPLGGGSARQQQQRGKRRAAEAALAVAAGRPASTRQAEGLAYLLLAVVLLLGLWGTHARLTREAPRTRRSQ